jgi:uncharacterized protein (TIGR03067 family)
MTHYLAMLVTGCLFIAADDTTKDAKNDKNQLQGTWQVVAIKPSGAKGDEKETKQVKFIFTDKKLAVDRGGKEMHEARYQLDPSPKLKTIDVTFVSGPDEGKVLQGIFELDGDNLKICWSEKGTKRPDRLTAKADSARTLYVLKRAKPESSKK